MKAEQAPWPGCPLCDSPALEDVFVYHERPEGEIAFDFARGDYFRKILRCSRCGHFVSRHDMDMSSMYDHQYVDSTYGEAGIEAAFRRIVGLDPAKSDNEGRVTRLVRFAAARFAGSWSGGWRPTLLDVGSGLGVFVFRMKKEGWDCTALDPDPRSVEHARRVVAVKAIQADFTTAESLPSYDVITFNKVLEHVVDPVSMLARARDHIAEKGFVYAEVPDGEAAAGNGPGREEFFIDHHHVFSPASLCLLAARAGFTLRSLERVVEPSGKYTLHAFLERCSP